MNIMDKRVEAAIAECNAYSVGCIFNKGEFNSYAVKHNENIILDCGEDLDKAETVCLRMALKSAIIAADAVLAESDMENAKEIMRGAFSDTEFSPLWRSLEEAAIYPQAVCHADGNKTIRTEWQDGWNAAIMFVTKRTGEIQAESEGA